MIKKLKIRFIVLAMASLTVLLSVIVAGMNIINYEKVVSDADTRIEILEENTERFGMMPGGDKFRAIPAPFSENPGSDSEEDFDENPGSDSEEDFDGDYDGEFFGKGGRGGPSLTRDEAEEARFFTVELGSDGTVSRTNVSRISAVDEDEAAEYAEKAKASGKDKGFIGEFRYSVSEEDGNTRITFLDCGRVLGSFRNFLKASILMSVIGLLIVFAVICYFAGRIVRPVAESYEKQKRFITDAGHEIKTPLAIIKANIDLMNMELDDMEAADSGGLDDMESADGGGDDNAGTAGSSCSQEIGELRESLGDIDDQVGRLKGLTDDLVYLSRMEEAGSALVMTDVPFSEIADESVSSFEALAREQGRRINADIADAVFVKGSTKELEKLMSILLENAVKYAAGAGSAGDSGVTAALPEIKVTLKKEGRNALLEVQNRTDTELTGDSLAHVFDRFYRTDSSRNSATGGHGIGLSMAQAIVNAHSGKISARTTDGSDFIIDASIPLA